MFSHKSHRSLLSLPNELLLSIACLLTGNDLQMLRGTCTRLQRIIRSTKRLHRRILYQKYLLSVTKVRLWEERTALYECSRHILQSVEFLSPSDTNLRISFEDATELWARDVLLKAHTPHRINVFIMHPDRRVTSLRYRLRIYRGERPVVTSIWRELPEMMHYRPLAFRMMYQRERYTLGHYAYVCGMVGVIGCLHLRNPPCPHCATG